jgi:phosphoribosyl 1,2-cyclic phosphodiesterase
MIAARIEPESRNLPNTMKLTFLGTRGEIEARTAVHRMHSCLMVGEQILVDFGADWLGKVNTLRPQAIFLTHAHLDHAGGLKQGVPCPVYATAQTWEGLKRYPIREREMIIPRRPVRIGDVEFEAFAVEHSLIAPAVGYRITDGNVAVFYVPDLVSIRERQDALSGIQLYIGDGASIVRPILRRRGDVLIGHASIRDQLDWCHEEGISHVVLTHCGSQIVKAHARTAVARIQALGRERGLKVVIANDGLKVVVRRTERRRPASG